MPTRRTEPNRFAAACRLHRSGDADAARTAYLGVLAHHPDHRGALLNLGALLLRGDRIAAALTVLDRAVRAHPHDAPVLTARADAKRRRNEDAAAADDYAAALRLDPDFAPAHRGLAILADGVDPERAEHHRARAAASGPALHAAASAGAGPGACRVLVLATLAGGNIPTRPLLDERTDAVTTLLVEHHDAASVALPPHDVVFNAIGDADRADDALARAEHRLRGTSRPVLNPPERVRRTGRTALAALIGENPDIRLPIVRPVTRAELAGAGAPPPPLAFPFLLRAPGFHNGRHFHRVDTPDALGPALASLPGDTLLAIECLDARDDDGLHRKYRVMLIGGALLPAHLVVGTDWKLHHATAGAARYPERRAAERRFLAAPRATIGPRAWSALGRIGEALALDYAGIDFGLDRDGRLLVFEANATVTLAPPPPDAERAPAIAAAKTAFRALLVSRARG